MHLASPVIVVCAMMSMACGIQPPPTAIVQAASRAPRLEYADAAARVARRQAEETDVVVRGLGSIVLTHEQRTPRVYVLLHGFTDVPAQFEVVGRRLFADGNNVYIPRLPHHGERLAPVRALGRVRADELAAFGDSTIDIALGLGDSVIVVGLSAGGAIAGWVAQSRPEVQRAVLIAPAIAPGRLSDGEDLALVMIASRLPEVTRKSEPADTANPDYIQGVSTHGLAEVLRLGRRVRDLAGDRPSGTKDIVFLINERDQTVSEDASLDLAQRWFDRGASVSIYKFPNAAMLPHNVMEVTARGGNVDVAFPVVEALARSIAPPSTVLLLPGPCKGFRCSVRRWFRAGG